MYFYLLTPFSVAFFLLVTFSGANILNGNSVIELLLLFMAEIITYDASLVC